MDNYGWYPGHMTKARRMMEENLKLVDLIIELADARIPVSSRNPDIAELGKNKSRVLLLTKSDLADPSVSASFRAQYDREGISVIEMDARSSRQKGAVQQLVKEACRDRIERNRRRGIIGRPMRAMVVGIPNVGKSTFINSMMGRAMAKTGNKPGVTRGKQWLRLDKDLELLDTPGILWPKFEDEDVAIRLALVGSIREDILDKHELCLWLIRYLEEHYRGLLDQKYGAHSLEEIAEARKLLITGGEPDMGRARNLLLDDFRNGRMGRITLEQAEEVRR